MGQVSAPCPVSCSWRAVHLEHTWLCCVSPHSFSFPVLGTISIYLTVVPLIFTSLSFELHSSCLPPPRGSFKSSIPASHTGTPPPQLCRLQVKAAAFSCPFRAVGRNVDTDKTKPGSLQLPHSQGLMRGVFSCRQRETWALSLLSHPRDPGESLHLSAFKTPSIHLGGNKSGSRCGMRAESCLSCPPRPRHTG